VFWPREKTSTHGCTGWIAKGQACAVLARGTMNSCLVQFQDGFTSRNALRASAD
jgi:hypothetical protein